MALPKLTTPTYELDLPSTGEKIKFRPFLVKEQKLLMMAEESRDEKQISEMIQQLIGSCTFGKVDAIVSPIFDVEYVFLQLRMRSVGAEIELNVICPDDEKTEVPVKINLEDVNVLNDEKHTNIVNVTDTIKMVMKYPQLSEIHSIKNTAENIFSLLMKCITEVHDGDIIHNRTDITDKELNEFVDSFNTEQLGSLMQFFETMPKVRHVVNVTNPNTKVVSEVVLEGMETFLAWALSHDSVINYYKTNFALLQHHKYSLTELENMMPWEREIYLGLLEKFIKDENERTKKEQQKNG